MYSGTGNNPLLRYQDILVETDQEARNDYEFDPRVAFLQSIREPEVDEYEEAGQTAAPTEQEYTLSYEPGDNDYAGRGDPKSVQQAPKMKRKKNIVIMDTGHRDWTQQSNAYAASFAFGSPTTSPTSQVQTIPVYENSPTVPPGAIENIANVVGAPNINGFNLSGFGYFPPYNPSNTTFGRIVTYVTYSTPAVSNFSTSNQLSNVVSIKLARAVLPYRRFFTFSPQLIQWDSNTSITSGFTAFNFNLSQTTPSNLSTVSATSLLVGTLVAPANLNNINNMFTSFFTEPYLLLYLNNFQGQYLGGNDPASRAFTVLAQDRRLTLNPGNNVGSQYHDFYPWSTEKFEFTSPLSTLPKFNITLAKNNGQVYQQIDDIQIIGIDIFTSTSDISTSGGSITNLFPSFNAGFPIPPAGEVGTCVIGLETNRAFGNPIPGLPPGYNGLFNTNEMRAGDRLSFYQPALSNLITSPELASLSYASTYQTLFNWMMSNDATVLATQTFFITASGTIIDYPVVGTAGDFRNVIFIAYSPVGYDGYVNPSNYLAVSAFPLVLTAGQPLDPRLPRVSTSNNYVIPLINNNMQATFAFEIETLVPDTSSLSITPPK